MGSFMALWVKTLLNNKKFSGAMGSFPESSHETETYAGLISVTASPNSAAHE